VVDLYRTFLVRDRIGDEYLGTVAGVAGFGLFVQVESPFIEGLVKVDTLGDDFYEYDERTMRLVGRRSGRAFSLGDEVRVRIEDVSVQRRKIDLSLVEHVAAVGPAPSRPPRSDKKGRGRAEREHPGARAEGRSRRRR
jgi:ribonuclease R